MSHETVLTLGAILALMALSALFSASETALTGASHPRMHQYAKSGDRRAVLVNHLRQNPERFIGAILLGNNLVNILASALATAYFVGIYGPEEGVALATVIMTAMILVFGEVLPKTIAFSYADRLALALSRVIGVIVAFLSPFSAAINLVVNGILITLGLRVERRIGAITEEELRGAIDLHRGEDVIVRQERAMLQSILDLEDVEVGEIMTHRTDVVMIDVDQPVGAIASQVASSRYSRIPLWRGEPDNIVGVIHAKALLNGMLKRRGDLSGLDILALAAKPWFVPDSSTLLHQLQAFRARREHFALVVDEYGAFLGVVTLEDILEEIVGDIIDEFDVKSTEIRSQPDGSYIVPGRTTIRDLNRHFDWNLPDDEASTIAGLILHEARQIPEVGQVFTFHGFRFEVLRRRGHQITAISLRPLSTDEKTAGSDEEDG